MVPHLPPSVVWFKLRQEKCCCVDFFADTRAPKVVWERIECALEYEGSTLCLFFCLHDAHLLVILVQLQCLIFSVNIWVKVWRDDPCLNHHCLGLLSWALLILCVLRWYWCGETRDNLGSESELIVYHDFFNIWADPVCTTHAKHLCKVVWADSSIFLKLDLILVKLRAVDGINVERVEPGA